MTFRLVFLVFLLELSIPVLFSQENIKVEELRYSGLIPVFKPVLIDSFNLDNKEYTDKSLLQVRVNFDRARQSKTVLRPDTAGVFSLEYAKDKAIQLFLFNIDSDCYSKAKLKITSTEMFEVYINGKKERSKETKETELAKASETELSLVLEPQRYEVIIKTLASFKNFNTPALKVCLEKGGKDSLSVINVSIDKKRRVNIRDILEGNRITDVRLSASGKYYISTFENAYKGGKTEIYHELKDIKTKRLIYRFPSSVRPNWMPSSDRIFYWRSGLSNYDFYIMDPESLEEKLICKDIKINSLIVSPDESYMLIHQKDEIPEDKRSLKRLLSPSDRSGAYRSRNVITIYDFNNEVYQRFTFGHKSIYVTDISPDSKNILLMTSEEDLSKRLLGNTHLLLFNKETQSIDTLAVDRAVNHAIFSPDGNKILILANPEAFNGMGQNIREGQISNTYDGQIYLMDLKTKDIKPLSIDFDPNITRIQWSSFDQLIYLHAEDGDREQIFSYDVKSGVYNKLELNEDIIRRFQFSKQSPVSVYIGESVSNAFRLYSYDIKNKKTELQEDPFEQQLSGIALGEVKDWNFTASDGTSIKGRYYLPPEFDSSKKYPMIVYYYGGTSPTSRFFESRYPLHVYAALGYVVYTLLPSGTTGFGQEFSSRHVNAWGKYTADDILEGVNKFCSEHTFVNDKKIGCIGASYGGFMTQYLLTKTNIFSAAVSHAGISALSSYWGEGYWGYSYSEVASAGSYPWNNPELYVGQSPLFSADKINTPLLLLHGSVDTNVPVGESIQMYTALKLLGKEVEFIQVEGENHAIANYQKRIDWNYSIFAWFAKWLKDQPDWWNSLYPEK